MPQSQALALAVPAPPAGWRWLARLLRLDGRNGTSPRWLVLVPGLGLLSAVLLTLAAVAWRDRVQALDRLDDRNELMARVFADRATRNVDGAALALSTMADLLARGLPPEGSELRTALSQTLVSLPFLRGVALIDAQGLILASSDPSERQVRIHLDGLGGLPAVGRDQLGTYVPARRLADLAASTPRARAETGAAAAPQGVGFLPLLRSVQLPGQPRLLLVAQINLEAFINFQHVTMDDTRGASALASYDGQLLAATADVPRRVGEKLNTLPPYTRFLPRLERGLWVGAGLRPGPQMAAFRVSATQPLVAIVEFDQSAALAEWRQRSHGLLAAALVAMLLIGAMTALAWRSVRSRELARALLDQAQRQVARRERELSVTIASLQELIFRTDAQGNISFVNERWAAFTGTPVHSANGRRLWDLVDPGSRAATQALFSAPERGGVRQMETAIADAQGALRWFAVSVMPLQHAGRTAGFAGSAIDVTVFHQAERAAAEARDAAEEASRAKSEFIANISHELRTPLQSIIGFSELGLVRSREQARLLAMFSDIHNAGQRMLHLVNDLLDVAKIESTVGTMNLERSDLRGPVRAVAAELAPQLRARQQMLDLQLPAYPLRAKVDPHRFEQVLRNVLANAIKFSPAGGRISVGGEQTDAGEVQLAIADEGPGIPPAELERIFEAFVQSSQTKDGSGGTGLGLAICRKILVAHGGHIQASNRPGGGAVFHIVLPARAVAETLPAPL